MKHSDIPGIISEVGFDFDYDTEKLWKLELPVEEIDISEIEWVLEIPFWWQKGGMYNLKPISVIENPEDYERKYKRIMDADTSFPIHIMRWKNRWMIVDGMHRLSKLKISGAKMIKVKKVPVESIPQIET